MQSLQELWIWMCLLQIPSRSSLSQVTSLLIVLFSQAT